MVIPKGGRGHKAPYETCTIRIPVAIRDHVERQANEYRQSLLEGSEFAPGGIPTLDDAIAEAKKILKQKKGPRDSIIKLLQVIYKQDVSRKDL